MSLRIDRAFRFCERSALFFVLEIGGGGVKGGVKCAKLKKEGAKYDKNSIIGR